MPSSPVFAKSTRYPSADSSVSSTSRMISSSSTTRTEPFLAISTSKQFWTMDDGKSLYRPSSIVHRHSTPAAGRRSLDGGGVFGLEQAAAVGRVDGAGALGRDEERVVVRLEARDA